MATTAIIRQSPRRGALHAVEQIQAGPEWFASWFDSDHYHRLYAARDDREAIRFLDELTTRLDLAHGAAVVDLGCGAGRHAAYLGTRGFDVTGIDLSARSLVRARLRNAPNVRFVRQDMREAFGAKRYDAVLSLFTSFGYFEEAADNLKVLCNVSSALKPGGVFVLDYLNPAYAEARLVPEETVRRTGVTYAVTRWSTADAIFKRILIYEDGRVRPLEFVERVAKLTIEDFRFMFLLCGLEVEGQFGSYDLDAFGTTRSPRQILVARKMDGLGYLRERCLRMRLNVSGVMPRYDASIDCGTR